MKKFLGLVLLVVLFGAAFAVYRATHQPRVGGIPLVQLSPVEQSHRRAAARELTHQVGEVAQATRRREHKGFHLTASEEQINTLLQDRFKGQRLPVNNLRVGLQQDRIVLQGDANYQGFSAPATLYGVLRPENGGVRLQVQSLTVGGFPAPDKWKTKIEGTVTKNLDKFFRGKHDVKIEEIKTEPGKLTVSGTTG